MAVGNGFSGPGKGGEAAPRTLAEYISHVVRLDGEILNFQLERREVLALAEEAGFDKAAIKLAAKLFARSDKGGHDELMARVDFYYGAIAGGLVKSSEAPPSKPGQQSISTMIDRSMKHD